jgi:hypothetical protein
MDCDERNEETDLSMAQRGSTTATGDKTCASDALTRQQHGRAATAS